MKNLLLLLLIFAISTAYSEENYEDALKSNFVNNSGRDFWFTVPPAYLIGGIDNFVKIFVFSEQNAEVVVSVPGLEFKETKQIKKNTVSLFNISPATAQVKNYNYNEGPLEAVLHRGRGINVSSESLITVYCVVRYSSTSDGFLCLPTNTLGTSYVATAYSSRPVGGSDQSLPNMVGVTATQNNTKMTFALGGNSNTQVPLGNDIYLSPGESKTYKLDRGDVVVFSNRSGGQTLSGSLIEADKNISVVSALLCADVPVDNHWCDYLGEMDLPVHTWGKYFHIPMVKNKRYSGLLRIFAKEDNTTIYKDGKEIGFILDGMGGKYEDSWFETRIHNYVSDNTGVALFSSDKPIYVMFYNPGTQEDGNNYEPIDPFSMVISPVEQYQTELTLTPPISNEQGKNFETNYLNLIYPITTHKNDSNKIEVAVAKNGKFEFSPLDVSTTFNKYVIPKKVSIDFPNGMENLQYVHAIINAEEGVQKIKSNKPIMAYLYGGDHYDNYGYTASLGLLDLTLKDTIPPTLEWTFNCNGKVENAIAKDMSNDTINSYLHDIYIIPEATNNFGSLSFTPSDKYNESIIPENTSSITWSLSVLDKTKEAKATIMCLDKGGNRTIDTISYFPQKLQFVDDVTWDDKFSYFGGDIKKNEKVVKTFRIINHSERDSLRLNKFELKYGDDGFNILDYPESPIAPLEEAFLDIEFKSAEPGRYRDIIGVGNDCNFEYLIELEATVGIAFITVRDINFSVPFNIADSLAKPMIKKIILSASCDNKFGSDLIITGIDDSQLPPEFTHNISSSFTVPTGNGENGVIDFEIEFMPTTVGKFEGQIKFIAENGGCDSVCIVTAEAISSKSLDDEQSQFIQLHPNPVKDELNISFINNSIKNYDIQLVDMTGNILYSITTKSNQTINMNKYSTGLYYIIIKDKQGKMIRKEKIIKQ